MKTIDQLLEDLNKQGIGNLNSGIPARDKKILISLSKQIQTGNFLTKNQGDLLIKILKENYQELYEILGSDLEILVTPTWTNPFRVVIPVRKIFTKKDIHDRFFVEFTWNKRIQQLMSDLTKDLQGRVDNNGNKFYSILYTEKNIHTVIKKLKSYRFEISEKLLKFFNEIDEILSNSNSPTELDHTKNVKITNALLSELGPTLIKDQLLLLDRKLRYQYNFDCKKSEKTLINLVAGRTNSKIWLDDASTSLEEILSVIKSLNRFPLMIILDSHDSVKALNSIQKTSNALMQNLITDVPGVYFRFDNNSESNIMFNSFINANKLNSKLDTDTKIAILGNNKLPKFLFKTNWYPKSVISFTNSFRVNKTSIWCDAVDLQIFYTDKQPLIGSADAIL